MRECDDLIAIATRLSLRLTSFLCMSLKMIPMRARSESAAPRRSGRARCGHFPSGADDRRLSRRNRETKPHRDDGDKAFIVENFVRNPHPGSEPLAGVGTEGGTPLLCTPGPARSVRQPQRGLRLVQLNGRCPTLLCRPRPGSRPA